MPQVLSFDGNPAFVPSKLLSGSQYSLHRFSLVTMQESIDKEIHKYIFIQASCLCRVYRKALKAGKPVPAGRPL
jgi:hypothetical protein